MLPLSEPSRQLHLTTNSALDALLHLRDALRVRAPHTAALSRTDSAGVAAEPPPIGLGALSAASQTAWNTWWRDQIAHDLLLQGVNLSASDVAPPWRVPIPLSPLRMRRKGWWGSSDQVPRADATAALATDRNP